MISAPGPLPVPVPRDVYTALVDYRGACRACLDCHKRALKGDYSTDAFALSRAKWDALAALECALGEMGEWPSP